MPTRIQRKRAKGWRKPAGAVCVTRPSVFGNPFTVAGYLEIWNPKASPAEAARGCVGMYRDWLREVLAGHWDHDPKLKRLRESIPTLRGKDLCCYCPPGSPCHADVLLELANR